MSYPILFGNMAGQGGVPGAPTIGTATATGSNTASVSFTAPIDNGGSTITSYTAISTPGSITTTLIGSGSGTINVSGLSSGTVYSFRVYATNASGNSPQSASSNQITTLSLPITNGLLWWLDASETSSYPGSGDTWYDISGNARHFTKQGTPTYVSAGTASYFTNFGSGFWSGPTGFMPTGTSQRTLLVFARMPASFNPPIEHMIHYGNTVVGESFGVVRNGGNVLGTHTWGGNPSFSGVMNNSTNYLAATGRNGSTEYGWINTTPYTTGGTGSTANSPYLYIGARISGAEQFFDGRIYIAAAYNRLLSDGEITTIYNTYKSRFGLP